MSTPKKRKSRADRARDIALYRYSLIRPLADPGLSSVERGRLVRELAAQIHLGPSGEPVTVSRASLDRWIRSWRAGGFDALIPAERQVSPRTDAEVLQLAARLKREHPARTAAHIARIIEHQHGWAPSPRTLQRHFARLELTTRPNGMPPKAFGRFEAAEPDELWVSDGLHGPLVAGRRAVLFALLDDHSRYVVGYRWGHGEDTLGMQAALHDAVKTHGCPQRLYCDNGAAYASGQLAWSAAVLDIKLVHSRPGKPQGRGKIERWNRTVRDQFLIEIDHDGRACEVGSLTELNRLFTAWLHQQYHRCVHTETGATPIERYHADGRARPPRPDPALLRRAFLWREQRRVTAVATVSLHGNRYQVDPALGRAHHRPAVHSVRPDRHRGRIPGPGHGPRRPAHHRPPRAPRGETRTPPRRSKPPASTTCTCWSSAHQAERGPGDQLSRPRRRPHRTTRPRSTRPETP